MNDPALYASVNEVAREHAAAVLSKIVVRMNWRQGETVLDVGCGPGDLTASVLLPHLPPDARLLGMDVSSAMVHHARLTQPRLRFFQADIAMDNLTKSDLGKAAGQGFDKIFSFLCLNWVPDQRKALHNIFSMLTMGGEALFTVAARGILFDIFEALAAREQWKTYMTDVSRHISPYHHVEDARLKFQNILRDVGFHVAECSIQDHFYDFKTEARLRVFMKALSPFLERIPESLQEDFLDDTVQEFHTLKALDSDKRRFLYRVEIISAHVKKLNK